MSTWLKLRRRVSWNVPFLAIQPLFQGRPDPSRAVKFKKGTRIHVRFPDGTEETLPVVLKTFTDRMKCVGHYNDTRYTLPGVTLDHRGIKFWVPLDEVEIDEADLPARAKRTSRP